MFVCCPRQIAATAFVAAWAVRLGGFLVVRVWRTGHDSRFDEAKHQPFTFWVYWTMQVRNVGCGIITVDCSVCSLGGAQMPG